mgnify:CR=1 FL=1
MGKRIMVVDDSRAVAVQLKSMLADTDYEIAAYCSNGATALELYDEVRPDLVTMDIVMPGIDGLDAARILIEEHPEVRVVMISSLAYEESIDEAKAIGTKAFIYKPLEKERLLTTLDEVTADL